MMWRRYRCVSRPLRWHLVLLVFLILNLVGSNVVAQEQEARSDENDEQPALSHFPLENGIQVFTELEADIKKAVDHHYETLNKDDENLLVILAIYSPSCQYCSSLLTNLEKAAQQLQLYFESIGESSMPLLFSKLDASLMDADLLEQKVGMTSFPTLLPIKGNKDVALLMEWDGLRDSTEELYETILHYWYRWSFNLPNDNDHVCSVIKCENVQEFNDALTKHGAGAIRYLPPMLNPNLSPQESSHIEWLLSNDSEDDSLMQDPLVLFVLCGDDTEDLEYHELSRIMAAKRNVLFFQIDTCDKLPLAKSKKKRSEKNLPGGSVVAFLLSPHPTDWNKWRDSIIQTRLWQPDAQQTLEHFVVQHTTPTILWYDRSSISTIAFPISRKIHAVLFIDVDEYQVSKTAIQLFYKSCQWSKLHREEDVVCLIVPQTERRILTTFGIDLWSPLDKQAMEGVEVDPVLPTLLITDQRYEGTRRYYLDATSILSSATRMHEFVVAFWDNRLTPFLQSASDEDEVRTNDSGVVVLTGATFRSSVLENTKKHTLLYLFAPTCGHCKRFSILWNELARLVTHVGWDSIVQVAKLDVTGNEIISHDFTLDVEEVPDVYFFQRSTGGTASTKPIRYDVVDEFGDGAGRLSESLDIVEWLLDVASEDDLLDQDELLELLEDRVESDEPDESDVDDASLASPPQDEVKETE